MRFKQQEYNLLQLQEKAILVSNKARMLTLTLIGGVIYSLYSYSDYYLEVSVDSETKTLLDIIAFKDTNTLDKYIENLSLDDLN